MAYSTSNPPVLISKPIGAFGVQLWSYRGADTAATIDTDGYITNAKTLGMKVGDFMYATSTGTANQISIHLVKAINANGSANLGDTGFAAGADTD